MQQLKVAAVGTESKENESSTKPQIIFDTYGGLVDLAREISAEETLAIIRSWQPDTRDGFIEFIKDYGLSSCNEKNEFWRAVIPEVRRLNIPIMTAVAEKLELLQADYKKKIQSNSPAREGGMI